MRPLLTQLLAIPPALLLEAAGDGRPAAAAAGGVSDGPVAWLLEGSQHPPSVYIVLSLGVFLGNVAMVRRGPLASWFAVAQPCSATARYSPLVRRCWTTPLPFTLRCASPGRDGLWHGHPAPQLLGDRQCVWRVRRCALVPAEPPR